MKWDVKHDRAKNVLNHFLDNAGYWTETESLTEGLTEDEIQEVSAEVATMIQSITKRYKLDVMLPAEPVVKEEQATDQPERHFEYVNPEHIPSMSFEGPVCEMLYYGILPSVRREFDKIFERYGLYYEFGHHWNFSCYYI